MLQTDVLIIGAGAAGLMLSLIHISFSAGLYQGEPEDLESLLHEADIRLYRAKQQGRARTVLV